MAHAKRAGKADYRLLPCRTSGLAGQATVIGRPLLKWSTPLAVIRKSLFATLRNTPPAAPGEDTGYHPGSRTLGIAPRNSNRRQFLFSAAWGAFGLPLMANAVGESTAVVAPVAATAAAVTDRERPTAVSPHPMTIRKDLNMVLKSLWRTPIKPYEIPYRCLLPTSIRGLLFAGRGASAILWHGWHGLTC